jgi:gentisate 1,2-dioxygenase
MTIAEQTDSLEHLFQEAVVEHAEPLWPKLGELSPPFPVAKATPYLWSYERLRPFCERAARLVGTELAERRVFMLINPSMKPPHTTDTLYAGLQTILPGARTGTCRSRCASSSKARAASPPSRARR